MVKRSSMSVNACIVAYDNPLLMLQASVGSVLAEKEEISTLFMVDNSPTDRLCKAFEDSTEYIHTGENLGFGKANNIAMQKSLDDNVDYHLLVNPDIHFEKGVIKELVAFMDENTDVGLVAPKVLYPNGEVQHLCKLIPTPFDLIGRRFFGWGLFKAYVDERNRRYEMHYSFYDKKMNVPILSGSFMLIRTAVLKEVGIFDERYFMYLEDFDLCRRIGEVSRTVFNPDVFVVHEYKKGSYFNRRLFKHHVVSAVKYFNKWGWFFDKKRDVANKGHL